MKDNNILKEIQAVSTWLEHPDVGERLKEAGISTLIVVSNKYGECSSVGYSTPSGLEDMVKCLIQSGIDELDEENACIFISSIIDYIGNFFDFDEEDEETCEMETQDE